MSESRKVFPVAVVGARTQEENDLRGCSELEPFALRVIGDSMSPEFLDGHVIVLDPGLPLVHGCYAVMEVSGEVLFRQYWVERDRAFLRTLKDEGASVEFSAECRLLGVVTQRVGARRADRKRYD